MCGNRKARQFCCAPGVPASEMLCAPVLIIAALRVANIDW
jgi:hypothetical protein